MSELGRVTSIAYSLRALPSRAAASITQQVGLLDIRYETRDAPLVLHLCDPPEGSSRLDNQAGASETDRQEPNVQLG